jgi:hypothetical protein
MNVTSGLTTDSAAPQRGLTISLVILAAVSVGLRVAAMRGDLMLDEIWTLAILSKLESGWEIFSYNHDNNHILNSLAMYCVGPNVPPIAYRIPATLAACGALWFGWLVGRRNGSGAGAAVLYLLGLSHVLILYGTEARGYAYLSCFTLAAWWAFDRFYDQPRPRRAGLFALMVALGYLSQLPFAFAYAGFAVCSIVKLAQRPREWRVAVVLHLLPILISVLVYFGFVQELISGGGEQFSMERVLIATFSLAGGGPEIGTAAVATAAVTAVVIAIAMTNAIRIDRAHGAMYVTGAFLAPAAVILISRYQYVYPRHFLVPMIFCYVAAGIQAARWLASGRAWRILAAGLLCAFGAWNLVPVSRLLVSGRAQYSAAVRWMAEQSPVPEVEVSSDFDFRNGTVAVYCAAQNADVYERQRKRLVYVPRKEIGPQGVPWYLRHNFIGDAPHPDTWMDSYGNAYDLVREFPAGSISGWNWWLYRRR